MESYAALDVKDRDGVTAASLLSRTRTPEYQALAEEYSDREVRSDYGRTS